MADKTITALTGASTPLAGTEVLPIVQSGATVKVATNDLTVRNVRASATTGILQVAGPTTGTTRVMTTPDANFTAARTDAAQSFTGDQTLSANNLVIGTTGKGVTTGSAIPLGFGTNGSTALATLLNSGGLSLGSTVDAGAANLFVGASGNSGNYGRFTAKAATADATSNVIYLESSTPARLFQVRSDGYFVTGAAASSPYNNTTGSAANVFVDSSGVLYRSTSSLKYKTNVQDSAHGLSEVLQLRSVTYQTKSEADNQKVFGGFIAEEIDGIGLSEFVSYRADDGTPDAIDYGNMVSLMAKAIQELNKKFDDYVASHP